MFRAPLSALVDRRVERRVVVHLELAVDLQLLAAGEDVLEQLGQRLREVLLLAAEDGELPGGLGPMVFGRVGTLGLLVHVIESATRSRRGGR